ncbi:MAG: TIGR04255 family protein [Gammaproteobacteria bacterium]|nr:TIGR04255 family protein [Gammaproteobacteria bacterium]
MTFPIDPLFGKIPERVHLNNSPLISVLGQAIFPKIIKISEEGYIGDFQESIRGDYPHLQRDNVQSVEVNLNQSGMRHQTIETVVWRFFNLERTIRVSLGTDSIVLEFSKYVSREEFISRARSVLDALSSTINPVAMIRVGCRYVDRIEGQEHLNSLSKLIRPELLNILQPDLIEQVELSMTDITCKSKEGQLIVRYGMAPPNFTHDPDIAPPVSSPSWVLDIDSFNLEIQEQRFDSDFICDELNRLTGRAYAFFRWSITEEFLTFFGASKA